ncbi:hypothetical protein B0H63DRAFT_564060 [Podospora didyma]|uniref:Uncharacterized protein n=1 Tax=Podospora didyma TaxID=330526 RepID=A0AAE0K9M2_9PEZI|nr:hypothetical protein B0H63DRAFT_564060 [Podospora didyma]
MKTFSTGALLFVNLLNVVPSLQAPVEPLAYHISGFSASKGHNSGYCSYAFDVSTPSLASPAHCTAYVDAGFSGATWLALVWNGTCNNDAVKWYFTDPTQGGDALFKVSINGITGNYTVPEKDITVWLNNEPNPFDNDVAYTGPTEFDITTF